jgi:catechol 2,3-dioxygenase-like lactoylglutathione lyase family enzyme
MVVRDLDRVTAYYRDMLGLTVQEQNREVAILGVGGVVLLELIHRPDAMPDDPREAGLYHTAFLMPTRADLARWILHAAKSRVPFTGASDHDVSEAIYLDDPEGNGVEVYSDRPREKWRRDGELIFQKTDPLDIDAIIRDRGVSQCTGRTAHIYSSSRRGRSRGGSVLLRRSRPRCDAPPHWSDFLVLGGLSPPRRCQGLAQQWRRHSQWQAGGPRLVRDGKSTISRL